MLTLIIPRGSPQQCARGSFTGLGRLRTGKSRAGRVPCERCPETFFVGRQIFCFYLFIKYLLGNYSTPNTELTNWLGGEEGRGKWNGAPWPLAGPLGQPSLCNGRSMPSACQAWECRDEQHSIYINQAADNLADVRHANNSLLATSTVTTYAENKQKVSVVPPCDLV